MNPCPPSTPRVMQTQTPPTRRKSKTDPDDPPRNQRKREPNHQRERGGGGRKGGTSQHITAVLSSSPIHSPHVTLPVDITHMYYTTLSTSTTDTSMAPSHHITPHSTDSCTPVQYLAKILSYNYMYRIESLDQDAPTMVHASQPVFNVFLSLVSVRWMDSVKVIF